MLLDNGQADNWHSVHAHMLLNPFASPLLPREEGCLCRRLAARSEYIWRSSESGQRRQKHQVSAEPKIGFQVKLMLYVIQTGFSTTTTKEPPTLSALAFLPSLNDCPPMTPVHWEKQYSHAHEEETEAEPLIAAKQAGCKVAGLLQAHDNHLSCQNYLHLHGKTIASSSPWRSNGSSTGQS